MTSIFSVNNLYMNILESLGHSWYVQDLILILMFFGFFFCNHFFVKIPEVHAIRPCAE